MNTPYYKYYTINFLESEYQSIVYRAELIVSADRQIISIEYVV